MKWNQENVSNQFNVIYWFLQISGTEALKNTTLKLLGINNGKAILRLVHRNPKNIDNVTSTTLKTVNKNIDIDKKNSKNDYLLPSNSNQVSNVSTNQEMQKIKELVVCSQNMEKKTKEIIKEQKEDKIVPSTSTDNYVGNQILMQSCSKRESDDLNNIEFVRFVRYINSFFFFFNTKYTIFFCCS